MPDRPTVRPRSSAPTPHSARLQRILAADTRTPLQDLLNRMLDGFDATYGKDAPRSVLISAVAREELSYSRAFTTDGSDSRSISPACWYRGVPIDVVSHDRPWLVAVIATRTRGTAAPALYGDTRTGRISEEFPQLR